MNLGIYLQSLAQHNQLKEIATAINNNLHSHRLKDASIFYDNVAHNPFNFKCGLFNSTDLWNFHGKLITTSLSTTIKSLNIVNNIDIYYYYGLEDKINPLALIYLLSNGIKIICNSENSSSDLFRKTGAYPCAICKDFSEIIESLG